MDIILTILATICIFVGLLGCFAPAIPGPPISYLGLLLLHWTSYTHFTTTVLTVLGVLTLLITMLDFVLPVWITKLTGGSKFATWGATVGLIAGFLFFPPIGIIVGPFLGAFIGEIMHQNDGNKALKSAFGALGGFLLGTGLKLIISGIITFYFFKSIITAII